MGYSRAAVAITLIVHARPHPASYTPTIRSAVSPYVAYLLNIRRAVLTRMSLLFLIHYRASVSGAILEKWLVSFSANIIRLHTTSSRARVFARPQRGHLDGVT